MGFRKPELPVVDVDEWSQGSWAEKIRPMARHWAEVGFGTPVLMHLFYVGKIALYILGAVLVVLSTSGIDGITAVGQWWTEPIVFQKVVLYTMAFEVIGLGCGFGPLNHRYLPPMGSILRAVMRCGAFELAHRQDVPPKVVISEYLAVADAFFGEKETGMTNGVLDKLAQTLRPGELPAKAGRGKTAS